MSFAEIPNYWEKKDAQARGESIKPKIGDLIEIAHCGNPWLVLSVGNKYFEVVDPDNPKCKRLVKASEVSLYTPPQEEMTPELENLADVTRYGKSMEELDREAIKARLMADLAPHMPVVPPAPTGDALVQAVLRDPNALVALAKAIAALPREENDGKKA